MSRAGAAARRADRCHSWLHGLKMEDKANPSTAGTAMDTATVQASVEAVPAAAGDPPAYVPPGDNDMGSSTQAATDAAAEEKPAEKSEAAEPVKKNSGRSLVLVLLSIALVMFLSSLDMTVLATSMPTIARELNDIQNLSWVATSYLLTSAAPMPLWGRLSDIFGRRQTLLALIALFIAASAICGAAPNMTVLIVGRALKGLGGGGMQSISFVLVAELVAVQQRAFVQGLLQIVFAVSSIVGPLLGGFFADTAGWRWIFWLNCIIGPIAWAGLFFFLRIPSRRSDSMLSKLRSLDWAGVLTLLTANVLLLCGLTFGGQKDMGWSSPTTICCLAIGAAFYPIFAFVEYKAKDPMIPLQLFRIRNYALLAPSAFILGFNMLGPTYYIPLWFQIMRNSSATASGLSFLPGFLMSTVSGFTTGLLVSKTGIVMPFYRAGYAILALGMGLDSLWSAAMPYWQQAMLLGVTGLGFGFVIVTSTFIVQASVPPRDIGPGSTTITFLQSIGGIFCLAIFNVVLAMEMNDVLTPELLAIGNAYGIPASVMDGISESVLGGQTSTTLAPYAQYLPPGSPQYDETVVAIQGATQQAFRVLFLSIGCLNVIPFVLGWFVRKPSLSGGALAVIESDTNKKDAHGVAEFGGDEEVSLESTEVDEGSVKGAAKE
ncbi:major facilitator superfamily domain-containing protein [Hyaloraphidium curvatum]|nr:major facilitator superfamily domain-containing protein [Hyaloraphidium curvatum]